MDVSVFEGWECIIKETTEEFCKALSGKRDFEGPFAVAVGHGALPHGVDPHDPRVIEIRRQCRERAAILPEVPFTD